MVARFQKTCEVGVAHMKNSGNGDKKIKYRGKLAIYRHNFILCRIIESIKLYLPLRHDLRDPSPGPGPGQLRVRP